MEFALDESVGLLLAIRPPSFLAFFLIQLTFLPFPLTLKAYASHWFIFAFELSSPLDL
jgi:hypothetical protein